MAEEDFAHKSGPIRPSPLKRQAAREAIKRRVAFDAAHDTEYQLKRAELAHENLELKGNINTNVTMRKAAARSEIKAAFKYADVMDAAERIVKRDALRKKYTEMMNMLNERRNAGTIPIGENGGVRFATLGEVHGKNLWEVSKRAAKRMYKAAGSPAVSPPLSGAEVRETYDAVEFGTKNAVRAAKSLSDAVKAKYAGRKTIKEPK